MSLPLTALKPSAFLENLIQFLLPFFIGTAVDIDAARAEILETLASYATRTRAEMLIAARIIAFGMSTLDALKEAKALDLADLSPSMKIRCRGCANALNRSTIQNEKALDQRLAHDLPAPTDPAPEPVNDVPDAEVQGTIDHARAAIQAHRNRVAGLRPATAPASTQQDRNKQLWAGAMIDTLRQMGITDGPSPTG
jgi:hypothetical protein